MSFEKHVLLFQIMMRQCAKTCGFCPQFVRLPQTSRCRDSFQRYKSKNIAIRKCF